jgi:hypothetical protein
MDLLVARDDLHTVRIDTPPAPVADAGQVLLRIDRWALTANNITYAAFGAAMRYWDFFPAPEGWGRVPVWGFADVEASNAEGIEEGQRFYGYFPMSTHLVVTPTRVTPRGFVDGAAHRAPLPPVYNQYERVPGDAVVDHHRDAVQALLRPLFTTSFLIDDWLAEHQWFGAGTLVIASASSKTAIGLAHQAHARGLGDVVGLTSARNRAFVEGLGCYDRTVLYDEIGSLSTDGRSVFVDMAGDGAVLAGVHRHLADSLTASVQVGATHWDQARPGGALPGPRPALFFAPDHVVKRRQDWGGPEFERRIADASAGFEAFADGWMQVTEHHGAGPVEEAYLQVLDGKVAPDQGVVCSLG